MIRATHKISNVICMGMRASKTIDSVLLTFLLISSFVLFIADIEAAGTVQSKSNYTLYGSVQANNPAISASYQKGNNADQERIFAVRAISNKYILPYSDLRRISQYRSLRISATPGEIEPASFVIQTAERAWNDTRINITELQQANKSASIPRKFLDIRLVKAWFQSARIMRRTRRDTPKVLVSELLLHDSELVKLKLPEQQNAIRTYPHISDSKRLLPFNIPAYRNQQIWITAKIPENARSGTYTATINITARRSDGTIVEKRIQLALEVLPFKLSNTRMLMGQFYLGRLVRNNKKYFNARGKNVRQMLAELRDMKSHGVNIITVDHNYKADPNGRILDKQLGLLVMAGFSVNPVVYVDWKLHHQGSSTAYREKLATIRKLFDKHNIRTLLIYNRDEKRLHQLKKTAFTFHAAHAIQAKNIVAVTNPQIALGLSGQLDYALIQHNTPLTVIRQLKKAGIIPIAYGLPHAGEEKPETTRYIYGYRLVEKGFYGTLSYAYQSGECWDDWMNWEKSNYRPNVMAYPTIDRPIPTLQWEAWREAVDDLRYLETFANAKNMTLAQALEKAYSNTDKTPYAVRRYFIKQLSKQ